MSGNGLGHADGRNKGMCKKCPHMKLKEMGKTYKGEIRKPMKYCEWYNDFCQPVARNCWRRK